jgi:hypothetical protein
VRNEQLKTYIKYRGIIYKEGRAMACGTVKGKKTGKKIGGGKKVGKETARAKERRRRFNARFGRELGRLKAGQRPNARQSRWY